jgi:predicted ATPase
MAPVTTSGNQNSIVQWGDLLLQLNSSAPGKAEASYRRAIERARSQEAKSWELRAATSLARLWRDQGKHTQAHALLAPVYGWFTEASIHLT